MRNRSTRLVCLVLGLLVAGAATPLRLAEAASDLAAALAEFDDNREVGKLDPTDGGVGDDQALGLAGDDSIELDSSDTVTPWAEAGPAALGCGGPGRPARPTLSRAGPGPRSPRRRPLHSLLQRFRF